MAALRELLPLPIPFADNVEVDRDLARATQRRLHSKAHWRMLANECVTSLNQLYAHGDVDYSAQVPSSAQLVALEGIPSACLQLGSLPDCTAAGRKPQAAQVPWRFGSRTQEDDGEEGKCLS